MCEETEGGGALGTAVFAKRSEQGLSCWHDAKIQVQGTVETVNTGQFPEVGCCPLLASTDTACTWYASVHIGKTLTHIN